MSSINFLETTWSSLVSISTTHPLLITLSGVLISFALAFLVWDAYIIISGLIVWPPPLPTSPQTRRRMIEAIHRLRPTDASGDTIIDPGCGFGGFALKLARAFPDDKVIAIDLQRLPLVVAGLKARMLGLRNVTFQRRDLFEEDYRNVQVIACYLFGNIMEQLHSKLDAELRDGCVVISNLHPITQWRPTEVIQIRSWFFVKRAIYAYRLPEARTKVKL